MPSKRTSAVLAIAVVVAAGGYVAYDELTGSAGAQTFESPANLTYPDGVGFHEESLERVREFAVETEREVVGEPAPGDPETRVYVCDGAFCLDIVYPREDGASRAFYHVTPNRTVRLPHEAAVRETPLDGPAQRIFLVNPVDQGRSVNIHLVKRTNGARIDAGTVPEHVGAHDVTLVTIDRLDANSTYTAEYTWQDQWGEYKRSLTFEPGNHSDAVWIFTE